MQTGWRYFKIEIVAQPFLELFDKEYASPGIEFANPFHMAEEKSFGDETRQGGLINRRGGLVHDSAHFDEGIDKLWRSRRQNGSVDRNQPPGCSRRWTLRTRSELSAASGSSSHLMGTGAME